MQYCFHSVVIPVPIDMVWEKIRNFYDLSWAKHFVQDCKVVGDAAGTESGVRRLVDGAFEEVLINYNPQDYYYTTCMANGPPPVTSEQVKNYTSSINLIPTKNNRGTYAKICAHWEASSEDQDTQRFFEDRNTLLLEDLAANFPVAAE